VEAEQRVKVHDQTASALKTVTMTKTVILNVRPLYTVYGISRSIWTILFCFQVVV
jgi:hypothetical protein